MNRSSAFSYLCNACGFCCHNKVITLSPYDVIRLARAAGASTREAIDRFTIRRGSILKFYDGGACVALEGTRCGVHRGRPLACRLYPIGIEHIEAAISEKFVRLEPAEGSLGVYGVDGNVDNFLAAQGVDEYLAANARYAWLLAVFRERIGATVDLDRVEPREFWRRAVREALAESNYDANPLIDAMFDAGGIPGIDEEEIVTAHIQRLAELIRCESNAEILAAAAVMLAVSLGYSPAEVQ
ncbi:MAG: YkgJ family cysteine cluster protein [Candidatus Binatus sp.]|uniref:YkgJ family cysteine cluster protein n=1 Tax=Candidatus Binatus sp. TaxID=2811406 RepID=UPI003BAE8283